MTLLNQSRAVDISLKNAELMIETTQLYYDIALDKLNSRVLTESGSHSIFMEAEAAAKKSKNALLRAIQKVIDFIKSAIAKISKAFSDMKMKKDVEAIKKIQNDPEVKKVKVEIPDFKSHDKDIKEYEDAIKEAEKKAKSGKLTQADIDKMNSAKEKCSGKKKVIIVGAAAGALTLGGLVIASTNTLNKMKSKLSDIESKYDSEVTKKGSALERRVDVLKRRKSNKVAHNINTDENVPLISDEQYNLRSETYSDQYIIDINKIDCERAKAELEVLYGSLWRKCLTKLNQFFSSRKMDKNERYLDSGNMDDFDRYDPTLHAMSMSQSNFEELVKYREEENKSLNKSIVDRADEVRQIRKRDRKAYNDTLDSNERQKKREQNYSDAGEKKRKGEGGKQKRKGGYSSKEDRIWNENAQDD